MGIKGETWENQMKQVGERNSDSEGSSGGFSETSNEETPGAYDGLQEDQE